VGRNAEWPSFAIAGKGSLEENSSVWVFFGRYSLRIHNQRSSRPKNLPRLEMTGEDSYKNPEKQIVWREKGCSLGNTSIGDWYD